MISGVIVLIVVTTSIERLSASFTPYYYTIIAGCALLIGRFITFHHLIHGF